MKLYDYFRSSASWRVRIALGLKGIACEKIPVNLRLGEQSAAGYRAINPQRLVPTLDTGSALLTQSLAVCEYLEETFPQPPLLPAAAEARAHVRSIAQIVACDVHPLANLRVLNRLRRELAVDEALVKDWIRHWIGLGFEAVEARIDPRSVYACGDEPTLADVCLVPQHYNALRFETRLEPYPKLRAVVARCNELPAFAEAAPGA